MKKFLCSFAAILVVVVTLTSCSSNSPKSVAKKFLTSFYQLDFDAAKKVSTDDTKKMLDMFQQLAPMMPDSSKQQLKKIKISIKDEKTEGDKSTVTYVTSDNPKDQTLHLVKQNKKWLVQWSKQDQLNDAGAPPEDQQQVDQQPSMSDSAAMPEASPATTPSSADTAMAK